MDKEYLKKWTGSLEQLACARRITLHGGRTEGMKAVEAKNISGLSAVLLESRCLDIAQLSYKGINMSFLSKAGLVSPQNYGVAYNEFQKHFPGGMLYTCGLENIGPPAQRNGETLPLHGSIGMTPAENVSMDIDWEKGTISITGTVRAAKLFSGNLTLKRRVCISLFENQIKINDTVENEGFTDENVMLLYHFNFGYPMLSEGLALDINDEYMDPRDESAAAGRDRWNVFEAPTAGRPEEVFYHSPKTESDGLVHVELKNSKLGVGAKLVFDKKQLPWLIQWKSMMAGDYALGIEPATARVGGYEKEKEEGRVMMLAPGDKKDFNLTLSFFDI